MPPEPRSLSLLSHSESRAPCPYWSQPLSSSLAAEMKSPELFFKDFPGALPPRPFLKPEAQLLELESICIASGQGDA